MVQAATAKKMSDFIIERKLGELNYLCVAPY